MVSARAHLHTAESLSKSGEYGHAAAHLVIAEEEMGKGLGYRLALMDSNLARIETTKRGPQLMILPGILDLPFSLTTHPDKTVINDGVATFFSIIEDVIGLLWLVNALDLDLQPKVSGIPSTSETMESEGVTPALVLELRKRAEEVKKEAIDQARIRSRMKERGLYVDISSAGTVSSPKDFSEEEFAKLFEEVRQMVEHHGPYVMEKLDDVLSRRGIFRAMIRALLVSEDSSNVDPQPK